jgi:hypothetical protein
MSKRNEDGTMECGCYPAFHTDVCIREMIRKSPTPTVEPFKIIRGLKSELEKLREENNIFRNALELIADNDAADGRPFAIARSAINHEPQSPKVKEERMARDFWIAQHEIIQPDICRAYAWPTKEIALRSGYDIEPPEIIHVREVLKQEGDHE